MAQHDYFIADQNGLNFLADLNSALAAVASSNSGGTEPASPQPFMPWADTAGDLLKIRNAENSAWIPLMVLSTGVAVGNVAKTSPTGAANMPAGTTSQRPAVSAGLFRYNSTTNQFEGCNGTVWGSVGGASGGAGNGFCYENDKTVIANYTVTSGKNAISAGPITVADGVTVTISDGSVWSIV